MVPGPKLTSCPVDALRRDGRAGACDDLDGLAEKLGRAFRLALPDVDGGEVGQELGQVYPEKLSFWWAGRAAFRQAAEEIAAAYGQHTQFRGISVNDMNSYQAVGE